MRITTRGLDKAEKKLLRAARAVEDLTPVTAWASQEVRRVVAESFATQSSPDGRRWPPRRPDKRSPGPLGAGLLGAVSVQSDARGFSVSVRSVAAIAFHTGSKHQRARPFLPFTRRGGWMKAGRALAFRTEFFRRVREHVVPGG